MILSRGYSDIIIIITMTSYMYNVVQCESHSVKQRLHELQPLTSLLITIIKRSDLRTHNRSRVGGKVRGWVQFYTCLMGNTLVISWRSLDNLLYSVDTPKASTELTPTLPFPPYSTPIVCPQIMQQMCKSDRL